MGKTSFDLRILGPSELVGPPSGHSDAVLRSPKRLAVLSYLALTTAGGFRRRDEVIGLFWPEVDQAQGRTYLRKTLHAIREDMGEDVFLTRGDDEIRVNPDVLSCDAVVLMQRVREERFREALDLYRGDLLAGLYPEGVAQEFEEWLRRERQSIRHAAAHAAWEVVKVEEERGEGALAAVAARRALEVEPDNEEGVRRLMILLDKRGDRAGALRVYTEWQKRLQQEFGVEPAPETRKIARHVEAARKGESHETPPAQKPVIERVFAVEAVHPEAKAHAQIAAPLPAPARSGRKSWTLGVMVIATVIIAATIGLRLYQTYPAVSPRAVAIVPFRAIGDPTLQPLADALVEELTTALALDSTIRVHEISFATGGGEPRVDPSEAARMVGAAHVVDGAVQRNAGRIRITSRLIRVSDAAVIWAGAEDTGDNDLSPVAQRLATNLSAPLRATFPKR